MFKVGDKVRCVDASMSCGELRVGQVYTVAKTSSVNNVFLADSDNIGWLASRFEKVEPTHGHSGPVFRVKATAEPLKELLTKHTNLASATCFRYGYPRTDWVVVPGMGVRDHQLENLGHLLFGADYEDFNWERK